MQARRLSSIVIAFVLFAVLASGFMLWKSDERAIESRSAREPAARIHSGDSFVEQNSVSSESNATAERAEPPSEQAVATWIEQTNSADEQQRAAAIVALANAPKAAALPALRRVLEGGDPATERPLALQSLRDLALYQGDEDGTIRTVVRETIYHSDEAGLVERAQLALEIIDESEMGEIR
jgi:HEAT repeat protein